LLQWKTGTEINTNNFVVEHSVNGRDFRGIGDVPAKGVANAVTAYSLLDKTPANGINYYRIKQVDRDSKFNYSGIAAINFETSISITCYPNPTKADLNLFINTNDYKGYNYQLFDMSGKQLNTARITNSITIVPMNHLKPASYTLKVMSKKGVAISFIVVKN
jgi:hypothetical protein